MSPLHLTIPLSLLAGAAAASPAAIEAILAVGPEGDGNVEARAAWSELARSDDPASLLACLEAIDQAGPLAANWLLSAAQAISERVAESGESALVPLGEYMLDRSHRPKARRFAFELIAETDPETAEALVPGLLHDPSPELRREAVARLVGRAAPLAEGGDRAAATLLYRQALGGAVDPSQVTPIAEALGELGVPVDLPRHFGFLTRWHITGPFDNTGRRGFGKAYPPEAAIDLAADYDGKAGKVKWSPLASADRYGKIDLNKPLGLLKESVAYAYTEFVSPETRPAELRLGSQNAWKIWLNGELVFARDEYHRGQRIDQYRLPVQLKAGRNPILVKVCQDEQTEEWTVYWEFQLRVTDPTGAAILSADRRAAPQPQPANTR